jgi:hypothetical protein
LTFTVHVPGSKALPMVEWHHQRISPPGAADDGGAGRGGLAVVLLRQRDLGAAPIGQHLIVGGERRRGPGHRVHADGRHAGHDGRCRFSHRAAPMGKSCHICNVRHE